MSLVNAGLLLNIYCCDIALSDIEQIKKVANLTISDESIEEIIQLIVEGRPFNQASYKEFNKVFSFMACYFTKNKLAPNWLISEVVMAKVMTLINKSSCYLEIKDKQIVISDEMKEGSIPYKKSKIGLITKKLSQALALKRKNITEEEKATMIAEKEAIKDKIKKHEEKIRQLEKQILPYKERIAAVDRMTASYANQNFLCRKADNYISFGYSFEESFVSDIIFEALAEEPFKKVSTKSKKKSAAGEAAQDEDDEDDTAEQEDEPAEEAADEPVEDTVDEETIEEPSVQEDELLDDDVPRFEEIEDEVNDLL